MNDRDNEPKSVLFTVSQVDMAVPETIDRVRVCGETVGSPSFFLSPWNNYRVGNDELQSAKIAHGIVAIGVRAFERCENLVSVEMPTTLKEIGVQAFTSCHSLKQIELPNGLLSIDDQAFVNCKGLTEVVVPNSVTKLGKGVFASCDNLRKIVIGSGVKRLERDFFSSYGRKWDEATEFVLPSGIEIDSYLSKCRCRVEFRFYDRDQEFVDTTEDFPRIWERAEEACKSYDQFCLRFHREAFISKIREMYGEKVLEMISEDDIDHYSLGMVEDSDSEENLWYSILKKYDFDQNTSSCLYFIRQGKAIKIGITDNLDQRFAQIKTSAALPCKIENVVYTHHGKTLERKLHQDLADYNSHLEWFVLPSTTERMLFAAKSVKDIEHVLTHLTGEESNDLAQDRTDASAISRTQQRHLF